VSTEPDANGELICEAVNDNVPSWGMYIASAVAFVLGLAILPASVPLLWGNRTGDLAGGLASTALSSILVISGMLAIVAARRYPTKLRIFFSSKGVISRRGEEISFLAYQDFDSIEFEIVDTPEGIAFLWSGMAGVSAANKYGARLRMYLDDKRHTDVWLTQADRKGVLESVSLTCPPSMVSVRQGLHLWRPKSPQ
jgi:hypothetical protein